MTIDLAGFLASMPAAYARVFDANEASEHASIAAARHGRPAHVSIWRTLPDGTAVLCIVADDRPGLLSLMCATLAKHWLSIRSAQVYCREREDGVVEAFDLFWVRASDPAGSPRLLSASDVASVTLQLTEYILQGELVEGSLSSGEADEPRVRYEPESLQGDEPVMIVEARDRPGLLLLITSTLHQLGFDILASQVSTAAGRAHDSFRLRSREPLDNQRLVDAASVMEATLRADP